MKQYIVIIWLYSFLPASLFIHAISGSTQLKGLNFPGSQNSQFCRLVVNRSRHLLKPVRIFDNIFVRYHITPQQCPIEAMKGFSDKPHANYHFPFLRMPDRCCFSFYVYIVDHHLYFCTIVVIILIAMTISKSFSIFTHGM